MKANHSYEMVNNSVRQKLERKFKYVKELKSF